ncbi:MAG: GntR family transcriptional regulator [Acinetobacter sp.]
MRYIQVKQQLDLEISRYHDNQALPSERYLALKYDCSRETVRKAYEQLRAEGKIYKNLNVGWFVNQKKIQYDPSSTENFNRYTQQQGFQPKTEILSASKIDHVPPFLEVFDQALQKEGFIEIIRLRYIDNVPVLIEYNYLPHVIFSGLLDYDYESSVEQIVQQHFNIHYSSSKLTIKNAAPSLLDEKHLLIPSQQSAIRIERLSKQHDQIVEFDVEIWREDKIEIVLNIESQL